MPRLSDETVRGMMDRAQKRLDRGVAKLVVPDPTIIDLTADLMDARVEIERLRSFEARVMGRPEFTGCWIMTAQEYVRKTTCDKPDVCSCACGVDARALDRADWPSPVPRCPRCDNHHWPHCGEMRE